jgi:hypothetical protein
LFKVPENHDMETREARLHSLKMLTGSPQPGKAGGFSETSFVQ